MVFVFFFQAEDGIRDIGVTGVQTCALPISEDVRKMRASYYLIGALLGRFKKARVEMPGGCAIGVRPIDQHIKGFEALGAKVTIEHGAVIVEAEDRKSTRLNSSHANISYAVFCLKKKKKH